MTGPFSIPQNGDPLVRHMLLAIDERELSLREVADKAGLAAGTLSKWKRCSPRLVSFNAVLNVLGLELAIRPLPPKGGA